jgi:hypothetical protein
MMSSSLSRQGGSDAEELLEGVLLHAGNAYEERKVPYLGNIFASVAFRSDISPQYAHFLADLAERLTYRQLVAIAFFRNRQFRDRLAMLAVDQEEGAGPSPPDIRAEIDELARLYLLGRLGPDEEDFTRDWGYSYLGDIYESVGPTELGRDLADIMELDAIPTGEQAEILTALSGR